MSRPSYSTFIISYVIECIIVDALLEFAGFTEKRTQLSAGYMWSEWSEARFFLVIYFYLRHYHHIKYIHELRFCDTEKDLYSDLLISLLEECLTKNKIIFTLVELSVLLGVQA